MANMITFLIAGHETTSGLISFAMLNLIKNESAYRAAQDEVDKVLGRGIVQVEDPKKPDYLNAVLRETLRLSPTAPAMTKQISRKFEGKASLCEGKYIFELADTTVGLLGATQRDAKVYGAEANEFKPERMLGDSFIHLPNTAWKPFGTSARACIGRAFAWQALMVMAMLLQNFNFQLDDQSYNLRIKKILNIKPLGRKKRLTLRHGNLSHIC